MIKKQNKKNQKMFIVADLVSLTLFSLDTGSNSKDPHEMHVQHKVAFHLGLHCLLK